MNSIKQMIAHVANYIAEFIEPSLDWSIWQDIEKRYAHIWHKPLTYFWYYVAYVPFRHLTRVSQFYDVHQEIWEHEDCDCHQH